MELLFVWICCVNYNPCSIDKVTKGVEGETVAEPVLVVHPAEVLAVVVVATNNFFALILKSSSNLNLSAVIL